MPRPHPIGAEQSALLRRKAEAMLRSSPAEIAQLEPDEFHRLLHELGVHQIELEIQNEELRRAQAELQAAHDRWRDLFDFAPVGYLALDRQGRVVHANHAAAELTGVGIRELARRAFLELLIPESRAAWGDLFERTLASGLKQQGEVVLAPQGRAPVICRVECVGVSGLGEDGPACCRLTLIDVSAACRLQQELNRLNASLEEQVFERTARLNETVDTLSLEIQERRAAQARLIESEGRYRRLFATIPDAILILDPETRRIVDFNEAALRLYGYSPKEFLRLTWNEITADPEAMQRAVNAALAGEPQRIPLRLDRRKDGRAFPAEIALAPLPGPDHPLLCRVVRDITWRVAAEVELRRERDFAENLIQTAPSVILVLDVDGRIIRFNPAFEKLTGCRLAEAQGRDWFDAFIPEENRGWMRRMFAATLCGNLVSGRVIAVAPREGAGGLRAVEWHEALLHDQEGATVGVLCVGQDITERRAAELGLMESEARLRSIVDHAPDTILTVDRGGTILYCNRVEPPVTPERIVGTSILDYVPRRVRPVVEEKLRRVFEEQLPQDMETRGLGPHGRRTWFLARMAPVERAGTIEHATLILGDVTERHTAEEKALEHERDLAHVARVGLMGRLTAELAHELNQPLTVIASNASAVRRLIDENRPLTDMGGWLESISESAGRAGAIVHRLRDFLRKEQFTRDRLEVNMVVEEIMVFVAADARRFNADVRFDLAEGLPPVLADRIQIQQVILNLVRNGLQAMVNYRSAERVLTIRSGRVAGSVAVAVGDRGCGVPEKEICRLFEPFHTTKKEGMGIGLSISRSIMESHGGRLEAAANEDRGMTFTLTLPSQETAP